MGRHRRRVDDDPDVDAETRETVEQRLGLRDKVCTSCNRRNPPRADTCRSCGRTEFRRKHADYANQTPDDNS